MLPSSIINPTIFFDFVRETLSLRFCQWKNLELNSTNSMSMNDFSVHRIIGRGGFGEVYGCRKADTGKMYAMKVCDPFFNLLLLSRSLLPISKTKFVG